MTHLKKLKKHRKTMLAAVKTKLTMCEIGESFIVERQMQAYVHTASIPLGMFIITRKVDTNKIKVTRTA